MKHIYIPMPYEGKDRRNEYTLKLLYTGFATLTTIRFPIYRIYPELHARNPILYFLHAVRK
jgi:hypothetical protein